jgi:hypothetical protein
MIPPKEGRPIEARETQKNEVEEDFNSIFCEDNKETNLQGENWTELFKKLPKKSAAKE